MFELTDKVAIVTGGGGRGIGRSISAVLAQQGVKVAIADLLIDDRFGLPRERTEL